MSTERKIEGFWNSTPQIQKIAFHIRGKISVYLTDGRIIITPLSHFPSIKKLSVKQRQKWYLFGNGLSFDNSTEVYHIEQILGNYNEYRHEV